MEAKDRRTEDRQNTEILAFVQVKESRVHAPGLTCSARIVDASAQGMRIIPVKPLEEGRVEMFVGMPSGERLFLAATIRWSCSDGETHEAGLEVENVAGTDVLKWRLAQTRSPEAAVS